ncbi:thioredoxin-like protein [Maribacter vaceletii]|uniref:Thioredoxin-like protein n=1 Tax=Maribacter vaceletii TaxID=1206816 RepID=A0A495EEX9_9FLAO|nr:thioredoxin family protein [Maribacter vaceletii]RKR15093.1 thioredoxin-like protein [Maribacter vaceletii]
METLSNNTIEKETATLIKEALDIAISYEEYRDLVASLAEEEKSTGTVQTEALSNYTVLNNRRMKRLDKTIKVNEVVLEKVKAYSKKITWLVLTESWCGDAAQTMPVMNKLAILNPNINLQVIQRDQNLELMNRFLVNGTLSIPKLIMLDSTTLEVLGEWGSRPTIATKMVEDYKKEHGTLTPEFKQDLQVWYNKDKGQNTIEDLVMLLDV